MKPRGITSTSLSTIGKSTIATRTPSRINSPLVKDFLKKDKFDFDAPQFEDFTKKNYQIHKRYLEEIVLPEDQRSHWNVEEVLEEINEESDLVDECWFQREHREHEPTSPLTPAGPLITPENTTFRQSIDLTGTPLSRPVYKESPLGSSIRRSPKNSSCCNSPSTPKSSGPSKLGLRAKPIRILQSNAFNSSDSRISSTGSVQLQYFPEMIEMKSPTRRRISATSKWHVIDTDNDEPSKLTTPLNGRVSPGRRMSMSTISIPTMADWSSIPETPILASGLVFDEEANPKNTKRSLPSESPFVSAKDFDFSTESLISVAPKRMGLATRALRVPTTRSSLKNEDMALNEQENILTRSPLNVTKIRSPFIKRVKVDARFCPAPPPIRVRNHFVTLLYETSFILVSKSFAGKG